MNTNEVIKNVKALNDKKPDEHITLKGGSNPLAAVELVANGNIIAAVEFLDGLCETFAEAPETIALYDEAKQIRDAIKEDYGIPEHTWSWSKYNGRKDSYEEWERNYISQIDQEIFEVVNTAKLPTVTSYDENGDMVRQIVDVLGDTPQDLGMRIVFENDDRGKIKVSRLLII